MFCRNCGKEIEDNAVICPSCGVATENATKKKKVKKPIFKKWWFWVIIALVVIVVIVSTGGNSNDPQNLQSPQATGAQQSNEQVSSTAPKETSTPDNQIAFESLTVVDNDECAIIITGIDPDNIWGYTLSVNLENKSSDKTYMFSVSSAAVNGVQCDPFFATEVAAGKKSVDNISFSDSDIKKNGIEFTDIELTFRVYDSNDWTADNVAMETVHVYPYGEDKAEVFERTPQSSDNIIIDNEYVTVTVIGYEEDNIWGYTVDLFLQNKTDTEVMFSVDEASVNGYMVDPFWATSVLPGKCAFKAMYWSDTALEESGITEIEEIEFVFRVYDYEDWTADDIVNETITLHP